MKKTTRNVPALVAVVLAGAAAGACGDADRPNPAYGGAPTDAPAAPGARPGGGPLQDVDFSGIGHVEGSASAPVQVVEFSDFGCGYCRRFHLETYPALYEEYVVTGRVSWRYVPFVLGIFPNGEEAALAGACVVGQEGFPRYRDRLFVDQDAWRSADEPNEPLVRLAREEGIDGDDLLGCLQSGERADRVRANTALGHRIGIRGTPAFMIEGIPVQGAQPLNVFRQILDQLLESGGASAVEGAS